MTEASPCRPCEKLVEIRIMGKKFRVPENNTVLRCLQYSSPDTIPCGRTGFEAFRIGCVADGQSAIKKWATRRLQQWPKLERDRRSRDAGGEQAGIRVTKQPLRDTLPCGSVASTEAAGTKGGRKIQ